MSASYSDFTFDYEDKPTLPPNSKKYLPSRYKFSGQATASQDKELISYRDKICSDYQRVSHEKDRIMNDWKTFFKKYPGGKSKWSRPFLTNA